jgi:hypothetical protein
LVTTKRRWLPWGVTSILATMRRGRDQLCAGRWSYHWSNGELIQVRRDVDSTAQVVFRTDIQTQAGYWKPA